RNPDRPSGGGHRRDRGVAAHSAVHALHLPGHAARHAHCPDEPLAAAIRMPGGVRSEEHTSELQSPCNLVCRLLLEKKKEKHAMTRMTSALANECACHGINVNPIAPVYFKFSLKTDLRTDASLNDKNLLGIPPSRPG